MIKLIWCINRKRFWMLKYHCSSLCIRYLPPIYIFVYLGQIIISPKYIFCISDDLNTHRMPQQVGDEPFPYGLMPHRCGCLGVFRVMNASSMRLLGAFRVMNASSVRLLGASEWERAKKIPPQPRPQREKRPRGEKPKMFIANRYSKRDLNPHSHYWPREFKSLVSTIPPFEPDECP